MHTIHPNRYRMSFPFRGPQRRTLPSLTDDRAHAHFLQTDRHFPVTGLELRLESSLALNDRYRHIIQAIHNAIQRGEAVSIVYHTAAGPVMIYGATPGTDVRQGAEGMMDVYWNDELMLSIRTGFTPPTRLTTHQAMELLMPYLAALRLLRACNGLIVIDHAQLLRYQNYQWTVYNTDKTLLYQTPPRSYDEMVTDAYLLNSQSPLHCQHADVGRWQITVKDQVLCDHILTKTHAREIMRRLTEIRHDKGATGFDLNIITGIESLPFPEPAFPKKVTVLLPDWVDSINNSLRRQQIRAEVRQLVPAQTACTVDFVSIHDMETLLPAYREWLEDVRFVSQLGSSTYADNTAAFHVLKLLLKRQP